MSSISVGTVDFGRVHTGATGAPAAEPFNAEKAQDITRVLITGALLAITALIVLGAFVMSAWALGTKGSLEDNLRTILAILNVVYSPIVALLGSVIGFYFGANRAARDSKAG
jgi:amino acid permease